MTRSDGPVRDGNWTTSSTARRLNLTARVTRLREAICDGDTEFALGLVEDLEDDLSREHRGGKDQLDELGSLPEAHQIGGRGG